MEGYQHGLHVIESLLGNDMICDLGDAHTRVLYESITMVLSDHRPDRPLAQRY